MCQKFLRSVSKCRSTLEINGELASFVELAIYLFICL